MLAVSMVAGCSADDDAGISSVSVVSEPADPTTSMTASTTSTTEVIETTDSTQTLATVPEQGVPGIDSEDPFCRAWSEFAGSFQVLTFASVTGSDPFAAARREVIAAAAVIAATQTLRSEFPVPIADEREVFVDDVIGPFARRAARAVGELRATGLSEADIDLLGQAWLVALAATGVDDPEVIAVVPADLEAAVGTATTTFAANLPPIASDPSLITTAEAPATFAHLADNCPDQGILGGNDAID